MSNQIALFITSMTVQDLKQGGAKPIAHKVRVQKFKPRPKNVDHAPELAG
jgi:hypothetical protein